jgi:HSP20 family protein
MLNRFDPLREFGNARRTLERFFEDDFPIRNLLAIDTSIGTMPLDVYEEGETIIVKASIPGFKPEEIKVQVREDMVSIWGETKLEEDKTERNYHLREHRYTRLERSVTLPTSVVADKAEAVFENGILTLTMPRAEESSVREVKVIAKA